MLVSRTPQHKRRRIQDDRLKSLTAPSHIFIAANSSNTASNIIGVAFHEFYLSSYSFRVRPVVIVLARDVFSVGGCVPSIPCYIGATIFRRTNKFYSGVSGTDLFEYFFIF